MIRDPIEAIREAVAAAKVSGRGAAACAEVPADSWERAAATLKVQSGLTTLTDLFCVDRAGEGDRFEVVAGLSDRQGEARFTLRTRVGEAGLPTLVRVHPAAEWYERECFDMFGIYFQGKAEQIRILTGPGFEGHPLRKDFQGAS